MRFRYTYHARARMRLRGVSEELVEQTVSHPDKAEVGYGGRELAFKLFQGRGTLKAVYAKGATTVVIITVIWE